MSMYCLKVWSTNSCGGLVYKDNELFVADFASIISYKAEMEKQFPNATYKIFHWTEFRGASEELLDSEPQEHIVKRKGDKVVVKAGEGYCEGVGKLATITDNGNGYTCKFHSSSSVYADIFVSLDYAQAEYLLLGLQEFAKDWKQD